MSFQEPKDGDIFLSLDPNLIYVTETFPTPNSQTSVEKEEKDDADKKDDASESSEEANTLQDKANFEVLKHLKKSLVNNPYEAYGSLPLNEFIPLILRQRGIQFSQLTTEYLQNELSGLAEQDTQHEIVDDANSEEAKEDAFVVPPAAESVPDVSASLEMPESHFMTPEEFNRCKQEIFDSVSMALNESSLSLELVSLLLSAVRNRQGMATMSPFLKNTVPPGSLCADKIEVNKLTQDQAAEKYDVTIGMKLQSLRSAQELISNNYKSLTEAIKKEQQFWTTISKNFSDSNAIFKMRDRVSGEKSLGVQYGYGDSGSTFTGDKGIAVLKSVYDSSERKEFLEMAPVSKELGKTELPTDETNKALGYYIKLRIYSQLEDESDYILTGESSLHKDVAKMFKDAEIGNNIRAQTDRLKFTVFEQELMYQMRKETNELFKYGCTIQNENKIVCEMAQEKFEIELLPVDTDLLETYDQVPAKTDDRRANIFLVILRMLLVVMFKSKLLHDRTHQPLYSKESTGSKTVAFAGSKPINKYKSPLLLIKPLLGKMRHNQYAILLKKIARDCILTVVEGSKVINDSTSTDTSIDRYPASSDSNIEFLQEQVRLFDVILKVPESVYEVELPSKDTYKLTLQSPNYCGVLIKLSISGKNPLEFTEFKELEEYLNYSTSISQ
ncbi:hypothetical protein ACO0QE_000048 [Hanseniaspora vineae]